MRSLIKVLLIFCLPICATAQLQSNQLDSLHTMLINATNDTISMDAYQRLGSFFDDVNLDSSVYYHEKGIAIARKLKLKLNEARMLMYISWPLTKLGNYPQTFKVLTQALEIAEDPANEIIAWQTKKGHLADRLSVLAMIHSSFGYLYGYTGDHEKRIAKYLEAKKIAESIRDTLSLALIIGDMAGAYNNLNKFDSALLWGQKSLEYFSTRTFEDRKFEGDVFSGIGYSYKLMGNLGLARDNFEKAIQISEQLNNPALAADGCLQLARLYQTIKKPDSSLHYYQKALALYISLGKEKNEAFTYKMISEFYWEQKNKDSSFAYLRMATLLNDSLDIVEKKKLQEYQALGFNEELRLQDLEKEKIQTQNKIRTYTMLAGLAVFLVIGLILYRNNRQKQKANKILETTLTNLKTTQSQLIQSEKMASLGELTAGIAHEIQNPLNFVNNFSEVNKELVAELRSEIKKGNLEEVDAIAGDIEANEEKISHHGKRADAIVKGMLQHSRSSSGQKELTDINALTDEYLRLAYHGLRAKDKSFNAKFETVFDNSIGKINIVPQDIGRVFLNLINNAFYAADEKAKQNTQAYEPTVIVTTKKVAGRVLITVADNGNGIPQKILDKIFQPFFTTKPTGQGTGLGLSLAYDIVQAHGGEIKVETEEGEGSEFVIQLPINTAK